MNTRRLTLTVVVTMLGALTFSAAPALAAPAHVYTSSFGGTGTEPGKFHKPSAVAVNEVTLGDIGDVYVADEGNGRVERFSPEGKELLGEFDGHETPAGSFVELRSIAVDNSTNPLDPSRGDIYAFDEAPDVIDKFQPDGTFIGTIANGAGGEPLGEVQGLAVDPEGTLWVYRQGREVDSYSSAEVNVFQASRTTALQTLSGHHGFAVNAHDDLYVTHFSEGLAGATNDFGELNSMGETLIENLDREGSAAVAVNENTGEVYVDNITSVAVFNEANECAVSTPCRSAPSGSFLDRFGEGHLTERTSSTWSTPL
jgi:DNA-binding beta-propeller fold protein YncE